ncbi:hypothetical protein [Metabacillus endolithicus]|uniref:DUF5659 domain-containing protein n=1 Tax=Metabacillus endolithicus TaxID=1535204 RepID=A0ABW5C359_9BACI|nr:hypothetical protein [Metabacillus endolithicus]UPG66074.1 hypothetical protein MVE64_26910 [Metabacillus endolithicus]
MPTEITKKADFFYILVDYGDKGPYLMMKVDKNSHYFKTVGEYKDLSEFDPIQAKTMLDEGVKFFKEARNAVDYYFKQLGIGEENK